LVTESLELVRERRKEEKKEGRKERKRKVLGIFFQVAIEAERVS
jgi:hypothetical protein